MAKTISTEELKILIDAGKGYHLIDVFSPQSFEARHIPTAVNIPAGHQFVGKVEESGVQKDTNVIVYCSSSTCGASPAAAAMLERAGFTNVFHYKDGLAGWQEAGFEFEP